MEQVNDGTFDHSDVLDDHVEYVSGAAEAVGSGLDARYNTVALA